MEYRDYTPTGWDVTVPDVLVAACERCGRVVAVPHQSTPKINEYRKDKECEREAIECRISRAVEDLVDHVTATLGGDRSVMRPAIFRYYLNLVAEDPKIAKAVMLHGARPTSGPKNDRRITIKVRRAPWGAAWAAARAAGVRDKGQLIRGIAALAARDFQVATPPGVFAEVEAGSLGEASSRRRDLKFLTKAML
jgi:hypothetical protein